MTTRGAAMVVYGDQAEQSRRRAVGAWADVCPNYPLYVYRGRAGFDTDTRESRHAKVTLLDWTPFEHTVYMDADTQVYQPISAGFDMLADGWDLVITPSQNQTDHDWLWHCGTDDRAHTLDELGYQALQLQAGVFFVAKNDATRALWAAWRGEWAIHCNQDQGALLRALNRVPVRTWLLGRPYNGGAVIGHHFGAIRRGIH